MVSIRDLEYLKGFTLLPVKDPLAEAWSLLKNAEGVEKGREFSDPVDPLAELGHQTEEQECSGCLGIGQIPNRVGQSETCPTCKGTGYETTHVQPKTVGEGMEGY